MPNGYASWDPPRAKVARPADLIVAAKYVEGASYPWQILPNVRVLDVVWTEGARPPQARFRYSSGNPLIDTAYPVRFEQVLPLDASGQPDGTGVIDQDTRIGVFKYSAAVDLLSILFDGFVQTPDAELNSQAESITFSASGTPIREWDTPLVGAVYRDSDGVDVATPNKDTKTHLPIRFNPDGKANGIGSTLEGTPTYESSVVIKGKTYKFPVFLGPVDPEDEINEVPINPWKLQEAARYIVAQGNPKFKYVSVSFSQLKSTLLAIEPLQEGGVIDFDDDKTYSLVDIEVEDLDVSGMAWPEALERLIKPHGFEMSWRLTYSPSTGIPAWTLDVYRLDNPTPVKKFSLQEAGATYDPNRTNVAQLHLTRDSHAIANTFFVDTHPIAVEASFILSPGFSIDPGPGGDITVLEKFLSSNPTFDLYRDEYRLFICDEAGEGHWDFTTASFTDPAFELSLAKALGTDLAQGGTPPGGGAPPVAPPDKPIIASRRRKPRSTLFSLDPITKEPLHAQLWVSFDYLRTAPGVWFGLPLASGIWNGTGTWDRVTSSDWEMLDDRIGIRIKSQDPQAFHTGETDTYAQYKGAWAAGSWATSPLEAYGSIIPLIEFMATPNPNPGNPAIQATDVPVFRLTCVVDCDVTLNSKASNRVGSPTKFTVTRRINARQRYKRHIISKFSHLNPNATKDKAQEILAIDDQPEAQAMAAAYVRAHYTAVYAGSITVPNVTTAYQVGDHISGIAGRDLSFASNIGNGASPILPSVVSVTYDNDQRQATTLQLSDRRAEFPARTRGALKFNFQKPASGREPRAFPALD